MKTFHKYLPISEDDKKWGLYTLNAGFGTIDPSYQYPSKDHPSFYYFRWETGRILTEYQLIYITGGEGVFESRSSGMITITPGCIIMLFPNEWHRYKPLENSGWNEYWVGFNGTIADSLIKNKFFSKSEPILQIGYSGEIISMFNDITDRIHSELMGYQHIVSGEILHLLGSVKALSKLKEVESDKLYIEKLIEKARLKFRENLDTGITPEQVAEDLEVSYSYFRKVFKKYTGIAPGQYFIQLKIERAKYLLLLPQSRVKQVAYDLGFESCFYFSKLFKDKTGVSPASYRASRMKRGN